jgi:hypothetical protein
MDQSEAVYNLRMEAEAEIMPSRASASHMASAISQVRSANCNQKAGSPSFVIHEKCIALAGKTENLLFVLPSLLTGVVAAIKKRYRRDVTQTFRSAIPMGYRHVGAPRRAPGGEIGINRPAAALHHTLLVAAGLAMVATIGRSVACIECCDAAPRQPTVTLTHLAAA